MNKLEKRLSRLERKVKQLSIDMEQTREKDERLLARLEANQKEGVWKAMRHFEHAQSVQTTNFDIEFGFNCFRQQHEEKKKGQKSSRTATSTTASSHKDKSSSQSSFLSLSPKANLTNNMSGPYVFAVPGQSSTEGSDRHKMNTDKQQPTSNSPSWDVESFEDYSMLDASTKRERIRQGIEIHKEKIRFLLNRMVQQALEESQSF